MTDKTNTTDVPLSDTQAVPNAMQGVDLSAFAALIPTYTEIRNPVYRELIALTDDQLGAMSKKRLRRRVRALEAMVQLRDQKIKELERDSNEEA